MSNRQILADALATLLAVLILSAGVWGFVAQINHIVGAIR